MFDVRCYGDFHGISQEAYDSLSIPFEQVEYDGRVLRVDHEGKFIWVEDFLEEITAALGPEGWGKFDFIDHLENTMTRYVFEDGKMTEHEIPVENVMESAKDPGSVR